MSNTFFTILYFVGVFVGSAIRVVYTRRYKEFRQVHAFETVQDRLLVSLPGLGMFVLPLVYALSPWLGFADYSLPGWAGGLGVALFAAALWLLWRSHADLGRNWSPTLELRQEHTLVTGGVFRHVRHPMYAAHWLWGLAQPLLLWNWIAGLSMLVTMLPLYLVRVPREERMLLEQFGDAYRDYMQRTGRIIPRLWK
jgi:protein-S-isoprenylcysteine O-methyltransferase Ste14